MDTYKINNLEKVQINNLEQWVLVRGNSVEAPLIINVQAGPGLPIIPEANKLGKLLTLENDFLVAYWDQRACGKSFVKDIDPATITFSQLTDDLISCTNHLLKKYKKEKAILIGYSIGATISLKASLKNSNLFERVFLVGLDIDIPTANKYAIEFNKSMFKFRINREQEIDKQLMKININPNDIKSIVLTHLHIDHIDGVKHFPNTEIVVNKFEWEKPFGNLPKLYPNWFNPKLIDRYRRLDRPTN